MHCPPLRWRLEYEMEELRRKIGIEFMESRTLSNPTIVLLSQLLDQKIIAYQKLNYDN